MSNFKSILNISYKIGLSLLGLAALVFLLWFGQIVYHECNDWSSEYSQRWEDISIRKTGDIFPIYRTYNIRTKKFVSDKMMYISHDITRDNLAVYQDRKGRYGYIDCRTGLPSIEAVYDKAWLFEGGLGAVAVGEKLGYVDTHGDMVIEPKLDYIQDSDYRFTQEYCCAQFGENWGIINRRGDWVIEPIYEYCEFVEATKQFIIKFDGLYGVMDAKMLKWIKEPQYKTLCFHREWSFYYASREYWKEEFEPDGTIIKEQSFDDYDYLYYEWSNQEGTVVPTISEDVAAYENNGYWGVINRRTGKILIPARYEEVKLLSKTVIVCIIMGVTDSLYDISGKAL